MKKDITRRAFLKGSAVGVVGVAAMGLFGGCTNSIDSSKKEVIKFDREVDVVIVGAGGAGLAAAVEASSAKANVLVLEKTGLAGGTTNYSGGVMQAAGTKYQKEFTDFKDDSAKKHADLWIKAGEGLIDEALVIDLANGAADNIEWLAKQGIKWTSLYGHCHIPYVADELHADRIHVYEGGGASGSGNIMIKAMLDTATSAGCIVEYESEVTSLIQDNEKNVIGVSVKSKGKETIIKANKGVILATASVDKNAEMAKTMHPQQSWNLDKGSCICAPGDTGDGIRMGLIAGGAISGMGGCIDFCAKTGAATDNRIPYISGFIINCKGRRFVCEDATYAYHYRAIFQQEKQLDGPTYLIFGESSIVDGTAAWNVESAKADVESGKLYYGKTIEELAIALHVPSDNLVNTLNSWNNNAKNGKDLEFDRISGVKPISGPFYASINVPCNLGAIGGLKINVDCQVLDNHNKVIKGLYAAGLNAGGWIGQYYPGSGTAIAGIIHQGRKAGKHIVSL